MDLKSIADLVGAFGLPGLVLILWWLSNKAHEKTLNEYGKHINQVLAAYKEDADDAREMYERNSHLVERYSDLARDLKDIVLLNAQALQRVDDGVRTNQFCPRVRLMKDAPGPIEGGGD